MIDLAEAPDFLVYLLHAQAPGVKPNHYVGLTTPHSWRRRMMDHASGNGGVRTARWFAARADFFCVRVWCTSDPLLERLIERCVELSDECSICQGSDVEQHQNLKAKYGEQQDFFAGWPFHFSTNIEKGPGSC
jgi:hypothetical protein